MSTLGKPKVQGDPNLQKFVDDVGRTLASPKNTIIPWMRVVQFNYCADTDEFADVAVPGVAERPKGVMVLLCEPKVEGTYSSGDRLEWQWRSGVIRVTLIEGPDADPSTTYRITLGVLP